MDLTMRMNPVNGGTMSLKMITILLCLTTTYLPSQETEESVQEPQEATVAFWNLENLFDFEDDPENPGDDEFLPEKEWDQERYQRKLDHLSQAVVSLDAQLIAVCEVENRRVLKDLIGQPQLASQGWSIAHIDSPDHRGIDLALLYREPFSMPGKPVLHPIALGEGFSPTRGVLEVALKVAEQDLVVLVNHWPSRYGGQEASAPKRAAAALTVRNLTDLHLAENPAADILIVGDLNDDPWDESVRRVLNAVREERSETHPYNTIPRANQPFSPRLWNPSWSFAGGSDTGTYYYWNDWSWNCFDQIIVTPGLLDQIGIGLIPGSVEVHTPEFLKDSEKNAYRPARFRKFRGKWEEGFSDHFPVKCTIQVIPAKSQDEN